MVNNPMLAPLGSKLTRRKNRTPLGQCRGGPIIAVVSIDNRPEYAADPDALQTNSTTDPERSSDSAPRENPHQAADRPIAPMAWHCRSLNPVHTTSRPEFGHGRRIFECVAS